MPKPQQRAAEFYDTARKRFVYAKKAWEEIRQEAAIDLRMVAGDQWAPDVKAARDDAHRPVLTFNRCANLVQYVSNQIRQNKPSIHCSPAGSGASEATAVVFEGWIRALQYASQADVARDHAAECSASCGLGFYRHKTVYINDDSQTMGPDDPGMWDQDIRVCRILDPLSVYFDPDAQEPNFSDAKYCFVRLKMRKEDYTEKYGDEGPSFDVGDAAAGDWTDGEHVYVCEYFHVEEEIEEIQHPVDAENVRERAVRTVSWDVINGKESLSRTQWVSSYIPIFPTLGREMIVDGKRQLISLIRFARDPQRLLNAYKSGIAEDIGLTNRIPYIGPKGSFKSATWKTANSKNHAYLEYDPVYAPNGAPLEKPARNRIEPAIEAYSVAAAQESDDIKTAANIFDSSTGAAKAEYSGISVQRRTNQADLVNFHFPDNLARTMWYEGVCLMKAGAKILDTPRALKIIAEDGKVGEALIATLDENGVEQRVPGREMELHHRLDLGRYECTIAIGPSSANRFSENFDRLTELFSKEPGLLPGFLDLYFANWQDLPAHKQFQERAQLMLPPAVQQALAGGKVDPQVQMLQAQLQAMQGELQKLLIDKQSKILESQTKLQVADKQQQTAIVVKGMDNDKAAALALLQEEAASIKQRLDLFHQSEMAPDPNAPTETVQ